MGASAGTTGEKGHRNHTLCENTDGKQEAGESGLFAGPHARERPSSPLPSTDNLLNLAASDAFHRWEAQLAATGHCAHPIRLEGRIDAIDKATGQPALMYDTADEPGGVLRIACGNRREDVCPACSEVYKNDARQIIRSGLTGWLRARFRRLASAACSLPSGATIHPLQKSCDPIDTIYSYQVAVYYIDDPVSPDTQTVIVAPVEGFRGIWI